MTQAQRAGIGNRIAPPRFLIFCALFPAATALLWGMLGAERAVLGGFNVAAVFFLASVWPLLGKGEARQIREQARRNDANRVMLLVVTGVVMITVLLAVFKVLAGKGDAGGMALGLAALVLSWLFSNLVYALHYAHLFYSDCDGDGKDQGGLDVPDSDEPDYWDFVYFAFTLGMTFQTSDVQITSRTMRRVALGHTMAAFVFNIGVIAFTINVLGGGAK